MKNLLITLAIATLTLMSSTLLAGDAAAGKAAYAVCSACHGQNGEGNAAFKAPKIAGQHDWYIVSALTDYKGGKRTGGMSATMAPMAAMLNDKQMADLAAYISSIK